MEWLQDMYTRIDHGTVCRFCQLPGCTLNTSAYLHPQWEYTCCSGGGCHVQDMAAADKKGKADLKRGKNHAAHLQCAWNAGWAFRQEQSPSGTYTYATLPENKDVPDDPLAFAAVCPQCQLVCEKNEVRLHTASTTPLPPLH